MSEKIKIQGYLDTVNAPWGKLFYELIWHNIECEGKNILDFGSGFGVTASHFAKDNNVTAVEPNEGMLEHRFKENEYKQVIGGIERLSVIPDKSIDLIICHNVIEYLDNREDLFAEFNRILKHDGIISIVKHNRAGKIMQKAVFEYKIDEAMELINNGEAVSANFGTVREYDNSELEKICGEYFRIEKVYGVRTFFALQRNEFKTETDWMSKMYELECAVEEIAEFRDIAFFHHVILKR